METPFYVDVLSCNIMFINKHKGEEMTYFEYKFNPSLRRILRSRGMRRLTKAMRELPEPKQKGKTRHPTWVCLTILLLSLTHGDDRALDASSFAKRNERRLRKAFGEGYSTPGYCTLVCALHKAGLIAPELVKALGFAAGREKGCQIERYFRGQPVAGGRREGLLALEGRDRERVRQNAVREEVLQRHCRRAQQPDKEREEDLERMPRLRQVREKDPADPDVLEGKREAIGKARPRDRASSSP